MQTSLRDGVLYPDIQNDRFLPFDIPKVGVPGNIAVFGPSASPLVMAGSSSVCIAAAATTVPAAATAVDGDNRGRVIAIAHGGYVRGRRELLNRIAIWKMTTATIAKGTTSQQQARTTRRRRRMVLLTPSNNASIRMMWFLGLLFLWSLMLFAVTHADVNTNTIATSVSCPVPLNPLILRGKRFFDSVTGTYVPIQGMAYYPRPNAGLLSTASNSIDFFTNEYESLLWRADITNMQQLGINFIRIYGVDPSQNHDAFMCALQEAGIYLMVGLLADCEDCGIGPDEAPSCYSEALKRRGQFIINTFSQYANVVAFSAGNEVTLYARDRQIALNAPCQKKFLRDMRMYVETCSDVPNTTLPRRIPIGMVNWDNERTLQTLYFNCQHDANDQWERPQWYGLNSYQHCDDEEVTVGNLTGWQQLRNDFIQYNLPIPIIIAEYGCRNRNFPKIGEFEAQRNWLQVDALYSPFYSDVFAGGMVFEYSAEKVQVDKAPQNQPWPYYGFMKLQYGVGYYSPLECDHTTIPCEYIPYPEFDLLQSKLANVDTSDVPNLQDYDTTNLGQVPSCPPELPSILDYTWPTDETPGFLCYTTVETPSVPTVLQTYSPALSPVATNDPPPLQQEPLEGSPSSPTAFQTFSPILSPVATNDPPTTPAPQKAPSSEGSPSPPTGATTDGGVRPTDSSPTNDDPSSSSSSARTAIIETNVIVWMAVGVTVILIGAW